MYECFHCGARAVIWDCDYDFEDVGYEGIGIVQYCHCMNCNAQIEYYIRFDDEDDYAEEKEETEDEQEHMETEAIP